MYTKSTLINIRWLLLLSCLLFVPGCAMPWSVLKMRDDKQRSDQLFSSEDSGHDHKERICSTEGIICVIDIHLQYFC